jgi:hypothetical protein
MDIVQGIPGLTMQDEVVEPDYPRVPTELIEYLEARFPNVCPDLRISQLDYGMVHGRLDIVNLLREMHDRPTVMTKEQP